jgi:NAD(P)-dependent dehydrogenase (short-subunit alcohol dehydrogenase family)
VHYGASRDAAEALVEDIRAKGGQADALGADLAAPDGAHRLAEAVRALGIERLDVLVNNAGLGEMAPIEDQTIESFDRQFAVNVRAPFFLVQQLLPILGEGSSVILLSSVVARAAFDGSAVYSATKGAVEVLTRNLAKELGPRGIRVNAIAPGAIDTDMAQVFLGSEEGREFIKSLQALKRIGQPDDIADAVLFLASDRSRWVDGRSIEVSGGANL